MLSVLVASSVFAAEYRDFTSADGKTIRGKVIKYDGKRSTVMIERDNRKRATVPVSVFSKGDQDYIKEWASSQSFLSNSLLSIRGDDVVKEKLKKEETRDVRYTDGSVEKDFIHNVLTTEKIAYEIVFKNLGTTPLKNISMEYCIYYEQSHMTWDEKPEVEQLTFAGKADVPDLPVKVEAKVETKTVSIHEDSINPVPQLNGDQRRPGKGDVHGVRVRLYLKNPDGSNIMREFCCPSTLSEKKYPWTTETKRPSGKRTNR
jgi:hypothetical protein